MSQHKQQQYKSDANGKSFSMTGKHNIPVLRTLGFEKKKRIKARILPFSPATRRGKSSLANNIPPSIFRKWVRLVIIVPWRFLHKNSRSFISEKYTSWDMKAGKKPKASIPFTYGLIKQTWLQNVWRSIGYFPILSFVGLRNLGNQDAIGIIKKITTVFIINGWWETIPWTAFYKIHGRESKGSLRYQLKFNLNISNIKGLPPTSMSEYVGMDSISFLFEVK